MRGTANVIVRPKDSTYCEIVADSDLLMDIRQTFSFRVEGYQHMPAYKKGRWDGFIYLFNAYKRQLYVGLVGHLIQFCESNGYSIEIEGNLYVGDPITSEEWNGFALGLKLSSDGKMIELTDYQLHAGWHGVSKGRALLLSATSSGKSAILYSMIRWHVEKGRKVLVVVPNVGLVNQLTSDFQDYSGVNKWPVDKYVKKIKGGISKDITTAVTVSTWQSIYKQDETYFSQFDVVFADEVHTCKAESTKMLMEKCTNAEFKVGVTGTLDDLKTNVMVLEGLFGPVEKIINAKDLIDSDRATPVKFVCVMITYPSAERKQRANDKKLSAYKAEVAYLRDHEQRNNLIAQLAADRTENTLILFRFISHGKKLYDLIKERVDPDRKVIYIDGSVAGEDRERYRQLVEEETNAIIVATDKIFSTGVNIKNLHNLIVAFPTKSKIMIIQSVGRIIRKHESKEYCTVYDIGDDLSWKTRQNNTLRHFLRRLEIYNSEGHDYRVVPVSFEES